jgi:hypothetical protein
MRVTATLQCRLLVFRAIVKVSVTDMNNSSTKRLRPRLPNGTRRGLSLQVALREETETADGEPVFCSRDVISRILLALVCVCISLHE